MHASIKSTHPRQSRPSIPSGLRPDWQKAEILKFFLKLAFRKSVISKNVRKGPIRQQTAAIDYNFIIAVGSYICRLYGGEEVSYHVNKSRRRRRRRPIEGEDDVGARSRIHHKSQHIKIHTEWQYGFYVNFIY